MNEFNDGHQYYHVRLGRLVHPLLEKNRLDLTHAERQVASTDELIVLRFPATRRRELARSDGLTKRSRDAQR